MRMLYILVDLGKCEVMTCCDNLEEIKEWEDNHQEKALYRVDLELDDKYPCVWKLGGLAL